MNNGLPQLRKCVSEVEVITMPTSPSLHFTSAATRPLPDQVSAGFLPLHVSVRRDFWTFSLPAGVHLSETSRQGGCLDGGTLRLRKWNQNQPLKKKKRNKQAHLPLCGHTSHPPPPPYRPSPSPLERADPLFKRTKWSECLTTPEEPCDPPRPVPASYTPSPTLPVWQH